MKSRFYEAMSRIEDHVHSLIVFAMRRLVKSIHTLKLYAIFLSIALFISCENWDLLTAGTGLADGLVAYYPFNGNTLDESGNGLNG